MKYLYFFLFTVFFSSHAMAQNTQASMPQEFEAYIGGFFGPSYKVTLEKDNRLAYRHVAKGAGFEGIEPIYVQPTPEQWQMFYQTLENQAVWSWEADHGSEGHDGTIWNIKLTVNGKTLSSQGHNRYPPAGFAPFLKAVSDLVGHKFE